LARFDALHMQRSPFAERCQRRIERVAERRQCVLDARRDFLEIPSLDDAIGLHLLEMLDQHLLADPIHHTAQFSKTMRLRSQRPQNQPLPFPADHVERCVQAATIGLLSHSRLLPHGYSYLRRGKYLSRGNQAQYPASGETHRRAEGTPQNLRWTDYDETEHPTPPSFLGQYHPGPFSD